MINLISFAIHYACDRNCFNVSHNKPWQMKICRNFEPWTIFSIDTQKGEPGRMFDICILMMIFAYFCHLLPSFVCQFCVFFCFFLSFGYCYLLPFLLCSNSFCSGTLLRPVDAKGREIKAIPSIELGMG